MHFGKLLHEQTTKEWRFYSVYYKAMKQSVNTSGNDTESEEDIAAFKKIFGDSMGKLTKFYIEKETWANYYLNVLEGNVHKICESVSKPPSPTSGTEAGSTENDSFSVSTGSSLEDEGRDISFEEEKSLKGNYSFFTTCFNSFQREGKAISYAEQFCERTISPGQKIYTLSPLHVRKQVIVHL